MVALHVQLESYVEVSENVNPVELFVAADNVILIAAYFLVTDILYVFVVPSSAVITIFIEVAEPAVKDIDEEVDPEDSADPLTVMVLKALVKVGVTVTEETELATETLYDVVEEENDGLNDPFDIVKEERVLTEDFALVVNDPVLLFVSPVAEVRVNDG